MKRGRAAVIALAVALALLGLALLAAGCGGDDESSTTPGSSLDAPPSGGGAPDAEPPTPGFEGLPPGFVECMAAQGYEVRSSADIHAAPPQVLQECFSH